MNKEQLSRHEYISLRLTKGSLDAINRMRSELSERPDLMDPRRINTTTVINFMLEHYHVEEVME